MPDIENVRVVILAGGKGTRLRPLTAVFPKPLVPLGERPVLEILLKRLMLAGFKKVTICTGYLSELIMAVCGDGAKYGLEIDYSKEDAPLGTAGPLGLLSDLSDPVIVMNGDLLTTLDFIGMLHYHSNTGADFTLAVYPREVKIDFGVIEMSEAGVFSGYREKPTYHFDVSMGINIVGRKALGLIEPGTYLDMPDLVLETHRSGGKVSCYREQCYWLDIGRYGRLRAGAGAFREEPGELFGRRQLTSTLWITGVCGFSGKHLAFFLRELPERPRIVGLDRCSADRLELDAFHRVDLKDVDRLAQIAIQDPPEHVIHLAGAMPPSDDAEMWQANVGGTFNLIWALSASKCDNTRLVTIGSAAEYMPSPEGPMSETGRCRGENAYGRTKWAQTAIALALGERLSIPVVVARTFNLVGPGLSKNLVAGWLCHQFASCDGQAVKVGNTESERDFVDIRDAVSAYWKLAKSGVPGEIYNVCSGVPTKIDSLISIFSELTGGKKRVAIDSSRFKKNDLDRAYGNCEKIRDAVGWSPRIPLEQSLKDMLGGKRMFDTSHDICFIGLKCYDLLNGAAVPRFLGGIEKQLVTMAKGLAEKGYRVAFITYDHRQPEKKAMPGA